MSFQVDTAFVNAFRANIDMGLQQKASRLRPYVRVESQKAEKEFYDRITATAAVRVTTRHGDTPLISTPHDRRMVTLVDYDVADLIDNIDRIRMLADPTSPYGQNMIMALGRAVDDEIISAASGTAYTGKSGTTATVLPNASKVAVTYNEDGTTTSRNLTIGKLRRARYLLDSQEANEDGALVIAVTASQLQALLRTTEVTSSDYNMVKALVNGEINTYLGFTFVRTERLAVASSIRKCLAWAKGAMLLAVGDDIRVRVAERPDKRHATQVYASLSLGAVRMWEEKCIEISCDETVL
jgi:hypothetical protein